MRGPIACSLSSLLGVTFVVVSGVAAPPLRGVLEAPGVARPGGDLSVSLGARAERSERHAGYGGFVALTLPLDRLAAPKRLAAADAAPADEPAPDASAGETSGRTPPAPARAVQPERPDVPVLSEATLARLARGSVSAALRAHHVALRRSELEGLAARSRTSAALPELRLRGTRSTGDTLRLAPTLEDPDRYTLDGGSDLVLEASATWKLGRVVFAHEELTVERLVLERERHTERLSARVLERLFDWLRALSTPESADEESRVKLEFERIEAELELDVLTGGWFGEEVRRLRPSPARPENRLRDDRAPPRAAPAAPPESPREPSP